MSASSCVVQSNFVCIKGKWICPPHRALRMKVGVVTCMKSSSLHSTQRSGTFIWSRSWKRMLALAHSPTSKTGYRRLSKSPWGTRHGHAGPVITLVHAVSDYRSLGHASDNVGKSDRSLKARQWSAERYCASATKPTHAGPGFTELAMPTPLSLHMLSRYCQ